jgi:hypothetical protein
MTDLVNFVIAAFNRGAIPDIDSLWNLARASAKENAMKAAMEHLRAELSTTRTTLPRPPSELNSLCWNARSAAMKIYEPLVAGLDIDIDEFEDRAATEIDVVVMDNSKMAEEKCGEVVSRIIARLGDPSSARNIASFRTPEGISSAITSAKEAFDKEAGQFEEISSRAKEVLIDAVKKFAENVAIHASLSEAEKAANAATLQKNALEAQLETQMRANADQGD